MSLKEQLNNYTEQPDAELYARIEKSLRRRRIARRGAVIAPAAAAAVVGLVFALRPAPQAELAQLTLPEPPAPAAEVAYAAPQQPAAPEQPAAAPEAAPLPKPAAKEATQLSTLNSQLSTPSQLAPLPASVETTPAPSHPLAAEQPRPAEQPQPAANEATQLSTLNSQHSTSQPTVVYQQPTKTPVIVDPEDVPEFYIPNAFAPEGDDPAVRTFHFTLRPGYEVDNFKLYIFNRGGRQVFYSTDINLCWDGTFKGAPQPMGNYVYKMQYRDADGNLKVVAGNVMLIRK